MKRIILLLLSLLLLLGAPGALAQTPAPLLSSLKVAPGDTRLDLGAVRVTDLEAFTAFLDSYPQLTRVDMYESRLKHSQIDALAARFPGISFGWTINLVEDHTIRTDATAFAINHNNRSRTHSEKDLQMLRYCRDLQALDLGHNKLQDISFLSDLKKLRVLILASNYITDIRPLHNLRNLEYAELFNNYIADFSPLMGLEHLIDLNICFNQTEDFSPLYGLRGLERLWVYNSNNRNSDDPVAPERVAALQAALPDTLIDSTHYSTLGGWRQHPRYYVVFNMLHGAVAWLPWSAKGLVPRYN
ncbi:MAG: leucine-rich repeat domain-containing protein [Christensenellales bacterium]